MTARSLMPTYPRSVVTIVRGEGLRVWDEEGVSYLDLIGGLGALSLGHAHPRWPAAVTDAAATLGLTTLTAVRGAGLLLGFEVAPRIAAALTEVAA